MTALPNLISLSRGFADRMEQIDAAIRRDRRPLHRCVQCGQMRDIPEYRLQKKHYLCRPCKSSRDKRPRKTERRNGVPIAERLARRSMPEPNSGCLLWLGSVNEHGYGAIGLGRGHILTHRAAWITANGPIPDGLFVCHRCDVPSCINPSHLFLGTNADNMADMVQKGRARAPKGESHARAKLSAADAIEIFNSSEPTRVLVRRFGISPALVRMIRRGAMWRSVTGGGQ